MSMDAGGLAQMTYNQFTATNGGLNAPGSGYASRGKAAHIKRLSVAPHPQIGSIYEDEVDASPTPRTSRSHLLAGLRTAPKSQNAPASAPYNVLQHRFGLEASKYGDRNNVRYGQDVPQTAVGSNFSGLGQNPYPQNTAQHLYSKPEQVLAPPALAFEGTENEQMDPQLYDELMATNLYLVQRQQQLQQQLINVTAAAQQFRGMNLNQQQTYQSSQQLSQNNPYNQQFQSGLQPIIQAVPGQNGIYTVYNPLTGQQSYFVDPSLQSQLPTSPINQNGYSNTSPESEVPWYQRPDASSPPSAGYFGQSRTITPPKQSPSPPRDVAPLPPPSANAFRPGHKKSSSSVNGANARTGTFDGPRSAVPRSAGFPQTPQTGTFGPGMARAGEHPIRQPRGPPPLEELIASPTSKHEGSKNFATRQRRRAVNNLVRAGKERRSGRPDSADGHTAASDSELILATSSDADSDGSQSGRRSAVSLRAAANGAIGSERKEFQERSRDRVSLNRQLTSSSIGSETNVSALGYSTPDARLGTEDSDNSSERRKMPMHVLTSVEKRKGSMN